VAYNPNILSNVLRARSLTSDQLSRRLKLEPADLQRELGREPEPGQGILNRIAKELAIPAFAFFMERPPSLHDVIPDFRSPNADPTAKTKETIQSIQFAEGIQRALEQDGEGVTALPEFGATANDEIYRFALIARRYFDITLDDQVEAKDARAFYLICRKKIEDRGIIVLHDSLPEQDGSGFCLSHDHHPIIVVNTKRQTKGRRLFTLVHELAHILMRKTGISDPFIRRNATERICNRFAGSFLVPQSYVSALLRASITDQPDDDVKWASRRLKISQEATAFRLEQLGLYRPGSYDAWKALVHNRNPDYFEKTGGPPGGEPPPQEKVKLAKYGFYFARAFDRLQRQGLITEVNLYRVTGLKPKYQRAYFDYAKSITPNELHTLELDDD